MTKQITLPKISKATPEGWHETRVAKPPIGRDVEIGARDSIGNIVSVSTMRFRGFDWVDENNNTVDAPDFWRIKK